MVLAGSDLRDGDSHNPHNLPILLAGQGGGRIRAGQHLEYAVDTPLRKLYLSMLQAMEVETDQFSDSTGALSEVLV